MSDLKRKYDELKQAHKELSVEVVELREKVRELECGRDSYWKRRGERADRYKAMLEFVLERVQFSKNRPHGVALKDVADVIEVAVTKALEADNGSQT